MRGREIGLNIQACLVEFAFNRVEIFLTTSLCSVKIYCQEVLMLLISFAFLESLKLKALSDIEEASL